MGIIEDIRQWASRVPGWAEGHELLSWAVRAVKTALTHTLVWEVGTLGGGLLTLGAVASGVHPVWALSLTLLGYALGLRFYADRELLGEEPDIETPGWRAKADAVLDFLVPWLINSATVYGIVWLTIIVMHL